MTRGVRTGSSSRKGSMVIRSLESVWTSPPSLIGPTMRSTVSNARGQSFSAPRSSPIKWSPTVRPPVPGVLPTIARIGRGRGVPRDGPPWYARSSPRQWRSEHVKATERWFSDRLQQDLTMARWGNCGTPVLVFPTAGGDAEEIERNHLVRACGELVESGRVKLYSCDSVAGRALAAGIGSTGYRMALLNQFHQAVRHEIVPAIQADLGGATPRIVTAGASIGAFNAGAVLCRYPDIFEGAIAMSGTYQLKRFVEGQSSEDLYF